MARILLNHNDSLTTSGDSLSVRRSTEAPSSLEIHQDGLYARQQSGSGSGGYPDNYRSEHIRSGVMYATDTDLTHTLSGRLVASPLVHRIFTCQQMDGSDISSYLRQVTDGGTTHNLDMVLPGDMYRYLDNSDPSNPVYKYYLILQTNGSSIASSTYPTPVATIDASESCN